MWEGAVFAREEGALTFSFFGERTSAGAVLREAARVLLVAGATGLVATIFLAVVVAARALFLLAPREPATFSLSSEGVLLASSLLRFLERVEEVATEAVGADLEGACRAFVGALEVVAAFLVGAFLAGGCAGGSSGVSASSS